LGEDDFFNMGNFFGILFFYESGEFCFLCKRFLDQIFASIVEELVCKCGRCHVAMEEMTVIARNEAIQNDKIAFFSWILDMARPVERAIKDDERLGGGFNQVESPVRWIAALGINAPPRNDASGGDSVCHEERMIMLRLHYNKDSFSWILGSLRCNAQG
jgi:hypothetical protein